MWGNACSIRKIEQYFLYTFLLKIASKKSLHTIKKRFFMFIIAYLRMLVSQGYVSLGHKNAYP